MSIRLYTFSETTPGKSGPWKRSKHADNLNRFQVSGVRERSCLIGKPDTRHLKPQFFYNMLSEKTSQGPS